MASPSCLTHRLPAVILMMCFVTGEAACRSPSISAGSERLQGAARPTVPEEESAIPPESIAGTIRLKGDIRPDDQEVDDVNKYVDRRTDSFNGAVSAERSRAGRTVSGLNPYKQPNTHENRRSSSGSTSSFSDSFQIGTNGQVYAGNQYVGRASLQRLASGRQIWIYRTPGGRTISRLN